MISGQISAQGGFCERIQFAMGESWIGKILVAESSRGVCAILPGEDVPGMDAELRASFPMADVVLGHVDGLEKILRWITAPEAGLDLSLDIRGTDFRRRVWQAICRIPSGKTVSYGQIAGDIGRPAVMRAVARACAANRLAMVIPCHRVVRNDGGLSGYRWGTERKQRLLAREACPAHGGPNNRLQARGAGVD
jgi:AraC family transcriptional regulator of adaptative response/methylated-DNA-[protein]-cysteine methyltransferase